MSLLDELRRRWWLVVLLAVVVLALFGSRVATFYTDVLWFQSIGYVDVFWGVLTTQLGLGLVAGGLMALLVGVNLLLARGLAPRWRMPSQQEEVVERYRELIDPFARPLLLIAALVAGVLSGLAVVGEWPTYQLWANAVEFGREDPQFGRDVGFFVFVLPFYVLVNSWLFTAVMLTLIMVGVAHYIFGGIRPQSPGQKISPQANVHLSILLAALIAVRAWGFWLDRYELSYSTRGTVTGLSYTDANAQLIAYQLLAVIAGVCAVLFLLNIRFRNYLLPAAGVGILLVASVLLSGIYPAAIQRLQVDPQELPREREFIARNLELTRFAFGLETEEDVVYQPFPAEDSISQQEVLDNAGTLESIRLWDPATLQNTYQQLQELRAYYDFRDVDVDRYDIEGQQVQTLLSVRELNERDLPSTTWQNQRLVYTHGYGVVASRASVKTPGGQPVFMARDIPPQGEPVFNLDNPRIYFGENPPEYSIVGTTEQELDFPQPQGDPATNTYDGADGVGVGNPLRRLAFALRYAEPNFVLSNLITGESKVLFNRQIRDRAEAVAPFLKFDHDPYPVAVDGRIKWIQDAYTTTNMVPYSQRVNMGQITLAEQRQLVPFQDAEGNIALREEVRELPGIQGEANYIRNSVKVVVDAYDGTIELYTVDPDDPILQAWDRVFPGVLSPVEEASEELISHFRYPEDMFRIQSELFLTYHIQDPDQFYTREDAWRTPNDPSYFANQGASTTQQRGERPLRPYYLTLRLPGEDSEEFVLFQPFTPVGENRNNLIAFLAGRSDPENYGELRTYLMPANELVIGPEQAQALVDQDDTVAQQITLWNQSGSRVIYGNLLVVPVGEALIYAQPLFLRAEQSDIPELQRVVLVYGDQVVMEDTLAESVAALFGAAPEGLAEDDGATPDEPGEPGEPGVPGEVDPQVARLVTDALERYAEAEEALRAGDLGAYQEAQEAAQELLQEAARLGGTPLPDSGDPAEGSDATPEPEAGAAP